MKELNILIKELRNRLALKELNLKNDETGDSYTIGLINNRKRDIDVFENHYKTLDKNYFFQSTAIEEYTDLYNKIKLDIDDIR